MTPRGKQLAAFFGIALALSLPKKVPCETPGRTCSVLGPGQRACRPTDMEPTPATNTGAPWFERSRTSAEASAAAGARGAPPPRARVR